MWIISSYAGMFWGNQNYRVPQILGKMMLLEFWEILEITHFQQSPSEIKRDQIGCSSNMLDLYYTICSYTSAASSKTTLVRLFMAGNIVAGKSNGGYSENPPNLTRHLFTCNIIFRKKSPNIPVILQIIPNFLSRLRFWLQFQSKITSEIKSTVV